MNLRKDHYHTQNQKSFFAICFQSSCFCWSMDFIILSIEVMWARNSENTCSVNQLLFVIIERGWIELFALSAISSILLFSIITFYPKTKILFWFRVPSICYSFEMWSPRDTFSFSLTNPLSHGAKGCNLIFSGWGLFSFLYYLIL